MSTDLRPLSTGELLDKAFSIYRSHFLLFAGIAAVANIFPLLLQVFLGLTGTTTDPVLAGGVPILALLIGLLGALVASAVAQGATVYGVSATYLGSTISIGDSFRKVKGKIGRIILINFAVGILVGIGLVLLVAPGLIWLTMYALAIPAAVLEDLSPNDSLSRSRALSEGSRLRILAVYVLVYILQFGMAWVFGMIEQIAFRVQPNHAAGLTISYLFQIVSQFGVNTLVFPLLTVATVLVYYDQRVRKEAFDLEHMMQALGKASAAGA
jgi:hypothetical protein